MPRSVRNFWIDLNVDGRTSIGTGPVDPNGGFNITILMRDNGEVSNHAVRIEGSCYGGQLTLKVSGLPPKCLLSDGYSIRTQR